MDESIVIVADSGSTKTDWMAGMSRFSTQGINPVHQSDGDIAAILRAEMLPLLRQAMAQDGVRSDISAVMFYGSGVRADQEERMVRLLSEALADYRVGIIEAHSDLLGAARALCGDREGLACILGTGANSCLYDGRRIVKNTPPMGYILGDEGSGAVLGARFLNALYKGRIARSVLDDFEEQMKEGLSSVIDRVYRQPLANRWLASLSPFIHGHLDNPEVEAIVVGNFHDFIIRNVEPYGRRDLPLQAVGSIAFFYRDQLCEAARKAGYTVGKILRSPLSDKSIYSN